MAHAYRWLAAASLGTCVSSTVLLCPQLLPCLLETLRAPASVPAVMVVALATTLIAWLARAVWLLAAPRLWMRGYDDMDKPAALLRSEVRTGVRKVRCIATFGPVAFCIGFLHPQIVVSGGLVELLREDELDAVLLHEHGHQCRRDPFRYALLQAAREACFFLPLVAWWADRQRERAELAADRLAIEGAGVQALAGALWTAGYQAPCRSVASFREVVDLRVATLLGEPLPPRPPAGRCLVASVLGLLAVAAIVSCGGDLIGLM